MDWRVAVTRARMTFKEEACCLDTRSGRASGGAVRPAERSEELRAGNPAGLELKDRGAIGSGEAGEYSKEAWLGLL